MQFDWTVSNKKYNSVLDEVSELESSHGRNSVTLITKLMGDLAIFHLLERYYSVSDVMTRLT